ncbi:hypothetical protein [Parashewanella tropica]|uniref:hypothetical protein n=1 Tax=Parashewanella tropica TaxID=2547970 RepID=UPI00105A3889|nr:hypothetical protein [Parashewanella tropica]
MCTKTVQLNFSLDWYFLSRTYGLPSKQQFNALDNAFKLASKSQQTVIIKFHNGDVFKIKSSKDQSQWLISHQKRPCGVSLPLYTNDFKSYALCDTFKNARKRYNSWG